MAEDSLQRLRGLLGLSVRAGQALFGTERCLVSARSGQAALLLAEETCSEATMAKFRSACACSDTLLYTLPDGLLERATGRPGIVAAVKAGGLAEQIRLAAEAVNQQKNREMTSGGASVE